MIRSNSPTKRQDYEVLKNHAQAMGFKRLHELDDVPWEKLRMALKAMKTKYHRLCGVPRPSPHDVALRKLTINKKL